MSVKLTTLEQLMKEYCASGRIAFYYPRLKRVSLNGGPHLNVWEAVRRMTECLNAENKTVNLRIPEREQCG